jgi:hypothetical protein
MACPRLIKRIRNTQNIGDSLLILNNNFYTLDTFLCEQKQRVESIVEIRTFFYYGPNTGTDPASSNMRDGQTNRPSNATIENFVNNTNELNLAETSERFDQVNIIYQKTGFQRNERTKTVSGTAIATFTTLGFSQDVPWSTTTPDTFNMYAPTFFIWKLVHNGQRYVMIAGYPKIVQSYEIAPTTLFL